MGDADAFAAFVAMVLVTEGDNAMPVLKPDRARGLEARRVEAREFVEKDAAVRVASAFWHELKLASPAPHRVRYHNTTGISATNFLRSRAKAGSKLSLDGIQVESGCISGCGSHARRFAVADGGRTRERIIGSGPIRKPSIQVLGIETSASLAGSVQRTARATRGEMTTASHRHTDAMSHHPQAGGSVRC
jgi:hypothetical protein